MLKERTLKKKIENKFLAVRNYDADRNVDSKKNNFSLKGQIERYAYKRKVTFSFMLQLNVYVYKIF